MINTQDEVVCRGDSISSTTVESNTAGADNVTTQPDRTHLERHVEIATVASRPFFDFKSLT